VVLFLYFLAHAKPGQRSLDSDSKELTITPQNQAPSITSNNSQTSS
jgi:hypothetical protein